MYLKRSKKARKAKSVFFRQFNDVDVYVEDTSIGSEKLYKILFGRALKDSYRIETVFPLGCKEEVIKSCISDNDVSERRRIYVVDGDLELITDKNPKNIKRLFVLNKYSIENYLIDKFAIEKLLHEEDLHRSEEEIKEDFDFDDWVSKNEKILLFLFVYYAIAKDVCPDLKTVSYSVAKLASSDNGIVDEEKISKRVKEVKDAILNCISEKELQKIYNSVWSSILSKQKPLSYISGKDYLFPLIFVRMRRMTKIRSNYNVIKQRLAMICDVSELSEISLFII